MKGRNHRFSNRRLGAASLTALILGAFVVCNGAFLSAVAVAQQGCTPGQILAPVCREAHLDDSNCIEIDDQTIGNVQHNANLYHTTNPYLNTCAGGAPFVDWVKDSLPNTDTPTLINSIATGLDPTGNAAGNTQHIPTARVGGTGHWNGVRIVDGVGGLEQDQFLTGGKEDDPDGGPYPGGPFSASAAWNIGPGTIGSPKYDFTQGYLANNDTSIYFGMERLDNNGTTEFEFEFNAKAPHCNINGSAVPTRSLNDILFTYLMQGSGTSGSLTPVVMKWDGAAYVAFTPAEQTSFNIKTSVNNTSIPCEPWGTPSKGSKTATLWDSLPLDNFRFGEAAAPLCVLLCHGSCSTCNSSICGSAFYVQVRTRSSTSPTSDLKDATQIFCISFGGLECGTPTPNTKCAADPAVPIGVCLDPAHAGAGPYTYDWYLGVPDKVNNTNRVAHHTGVAGICDTYTTSVAGTYFVIITDAHGCTTSAPCQVTLTVNPNPTCSVTPVSNCAGTDVSLTANPVGGTGDTDPTHFTYSWSPSGKTTRTITKSSAVGDPASDFSETVTVTEIATGCSSTGCSSTAHIYKNPTVTPTQTTVCADDDGPDHLNHIDAGFTAGTGSSPVFVWTGPFSASNPNPGNASSFDTLVAGHYCVTVTDSNNCTASGCVDATFYPAPVIQPLTKGAQQDANGNPEAKVSASFDQTDPATIVAWSVSSDKGTQNPAGNTNLAAGTSSIIITEAMFKALDTPKITTGVSLPGYPGLVFTEYDYEVTATVTVTSSNGCISHKSVLVVFSIFVDPTSKKEYKKSLH